MILNNSYRQTVTDIIKTNRGGNIFVCKHIFSVANTHDRSRRY